MGHAVMSVTKGYGFKPFQSETGCHALLIANKKQKTVMSVTKGYGFKPFQSETGCHALLIAKNKQKNKTKQNSQNNLAYIGLKYAYGMVFAL